MIETEKLKLKYNMKTPLSQQNIPKTNLKQQKATWHQSKVFLIIKLSLLPFLYFILSQGNCLYFPELDMGPVITDYQFLADTIQKLMFTSAPQTCDIRCLGDKIPCWKKQDLMKVWSGASEDQIVSPNSIFYFLSSL